MSIRSGFRSLTPGRLLKAALLAALTYAITWRTPGTPWHPDTLVPALTATYTALQYLTWARTTQRRLINASTLLGALAASILLPTPLNIIAAYGLILTPLTIAATRRLSTTIVKSRRRTRPTIRATRVTAATASRNAPAPEAVEVAPARTKQGITVTPAREHRPEPETPAAPTVTNIPQPMWWNSNNLNDTTIPSMHINSEVDLYTTEGIQEAWFTVTEPYMLGETPVVDVAPFPASIAGHGLPWPTASLGATSRHRPN